MRIHISNITNVHMMVIWDYGNLENVSMYDFKSKSKKNYLPLAWFYFSIQIIEKIMYFCFYSVTISKTHLDLILETRRISRLNLRRMNRHDGTFNGGRGRGILTRLLKSIKSISELQFYEGTLEWNCQGLK